MTMSGTVGGGTRAELLELAGDLKHDVGKYVAWMSANLEEAAWTGPVDDALVDALRADILRTRTGRDGEVEPVWSIWSRHTRRIPRALEIPELREVDVAIEVLRDAAGVLESGDPKGVAAVRAPVRQAQRTIRARLLDFHRRLRQELA